ncbi:hypothetical protein K402DRAFT_327682 [Aulographum hederae CBS 113979]|uniref:Uncharacterized protein n=1 Tax=Aulographum hederae CBS 113979 TaxID=1176131 RepID=A0A6G1H7S6_9PEZI|nr:hypothetical protein K402DRAFT_327682 [Aulographum hederae CBS 113979]
MRTASFKYFGKALADQDRWEAVWQAMGGTKGLVDFFAAISVSDVKCLVRWIACCNGGHKRVEKREHAIEELLRALLPSHYPGSEHQSQDRRPIQHHYHQLVVACSPDFIKPILDSKDDSNPLLAELAGKRFFKAHEEFLRTYVAETVLDGEKKRLETDQYFKSFVYKSPSRPGPSRKISASMAFAVEILQKRLDDTNIDKSWPRYITEADILSSLLRRSLKKRLSESSIGNLLMMGIRLLEAKPGLKSAFQREDIWSLIFSRWRKDPALHQDLLARALRLGLGGAQNSIGRQYLQASASVKPELKWPLLRMYCLYVPEKGIDLDTTEDYKALANQTWPKDVFFQVKEAQAIRLLRGLQSVNPEYGFLQEPPHMTSILSMAHMVSIRNFNAILLLNLLQPYSKDALVKAERRVDEFRKKATTAKDQPERAQFARAASLCAIASGSLDLYSNAITWQQRFVRDPLTVKVIFGSDTVSTTEGVELLSGIPQPLPNGMTLADIAARVRVANKILTALHETMIMAKKEPSFYSPDWYGVTSLYGAVVTERVNRAKKLQDSLKGLSTDTYTAIWSDTLAMFDNLGLDALNQAYEPISSLFSTLPPTTLATTARAMLESGNERRKKEDRQDVDDTLERLSYRVLLRLASSDKPELAQQLVLRTILDRPDASSWHRELLSSSFMKSLCAKDAQELLLAFAAAIGEKLEEQSYVKVGEKAPSKSAAPQSSVKITTVKYLAQLLDNAEFISADAAVEVLVELFKAGTHQDIRLATLESLLNHLSKICNEPGEAWRSNPLVEKIMKALETVVPIVGGINERRPLTAQQWQDAINKGTLPEISDVVSGGLPPLLHAIVIAASRSHYAGLDKLKADFVKRFLLPILRLSQDEHRKWIASFLKKYRAGFQIDDLPPTPISQALFGQLVEYWAEFLPVAVFKDFNEHTVMSIAPPKPFTEFSERLKSDVDLRLDPNVQHWLWVYGNTVDTFHTSGTTSLIDLINGNRTSSLVDDGISLTELQTMILEQASLFLDNYANHASLWSSLVRGLRHPSRMMYYYQNSELISSKFRQWQDCGRKVLEQLLALLQEKRRQHQQQGKRSILPSTTELRVWLLPFPCFPEGDEQVDVECRTFAKAAVDLLQDCVKSEKNTLLWPKVAKDASSISELLNKDDERLHVAVYIGNYEEFPAGEEDTLELSAMKYLRVELALGLLKDGKGFLKNKKDYAAKEAEKKKAIEHEGRIRGMLDGWKNDADEGIRVMLHSWTEKNGPVIEES